MKCYNFITDAKIKAYLNEIACGYKISEEFEDSDIVDYDNGSHSILPFIFDPSEVFENIKYNYWLDIKIEITQNLGEPDSYWNGEVCDFCKLRNVVGFRVSDEVWEEVVGNENIILCTSCFDDKAENCGQKYEFLEVWPIPWSHWLEK